MKKLLFIGLSLFAAAFMAACNKGMNVKVIEEQDPITKIMEERDSMRVFKTDSLEKAPKNK